MAAIFRKELQSFFSSIIGYVVVGVFLTISGLFMWVFKDTSILNGPFAVLDQLFFMAPYIFLFLIPAMTMRSFADEFQKGTIEILYSKPLSIWQIILGKYWAYLVLVIIILLFTLTYYYSLYHLASPVGNIDHGSIIGSYIGMFLLGAVYVSIGLFASSVSNSQVTAFLLAVILCFILFWGFYYVSSLPVFTAGLDIILEKCGIDYHYTSVSRGVIDSRDLSYFIFLILFFISASFIALEKRK